ncbi:hypothetical protein ASE66_24415 [Bosea sp. Root483D1]|uniref:hypothetical protein n=1 Tax=Bosea sp. Root483D1 TaxID=1736544 RepID=UPI0007097BE5|nr:hypothetical protein [Bosea sp. Root483D1]KRE11669.1 hypothetical protein ASE66_24415 [Bosea sp. Root483D1]
MITSIVLAMAVTGCAGWNKGAPSCDGSAKRPLNRSLWDWETKPAAIPTPDLPPVKRLGRAEPFGVGSQVAQVWGEGASFDIARSFLPCREASRHG